MTERTEISDAIRRINGDLMTCIQAMETMRPIVSDSMLLSKFDSTYSAHVVSWLQDILRDHAIMTLCRIWDMDTDAQSIPSVTSSLPQKNKMQVSHRKYDHVLCVVDMMCKSDRLKRLQNWRDKYLGHALETSRREKNGAIRSPTWDEIFVLYRRTAVIVEALMVVTADIAIDHAKIRKINAQYAEAFWGSFIDKPK